MSKYAADGSLVWIKTFREPDVFGDPTRVGANAVATDADGNVYFMFYKSYHPYQSRHLYIRKYNALGKRLWEKMIGGYAYYAPSPIMTTDADGNIYTSVYTSIYKYDTRGNFLWSSTINSSNTYVSDITTDADGNIYIAGRTGGSLEGTNLGDYDAYIRKYDGSSTILWTRQFGTSSSDWANSITTDAIGYVYIAGSTLGSLQGTNKGDYDAYLRKYDSDGNVLQTRQFGTRKFDSGLLVKTSGNGDVLVAGRTQGNLQGQNQGSYDAYLRKYTP
jgi:hypothetical protein